MEQYVHVVIHRSEPAPPDAVSALLATGELRPATMAGPIPRPTGPIRTDDEAGDLLRRLPDDERF
ncbi:prevent-host-death family protein [Amycolatopsis granulosa]|uniref:prevent-host-death family protein n=1 Tax=Amycolatopsis granulosa TaxID=185684 RepID=UPI0014236B6B|nr:prevent-host-death family protein [Amycolatopsis granulosa]NIH86520.1 hypothetical protein [Amycolatopsis granulosa]